MSDCFVEQIKQSLSQSDGRYQERALKILAEESWQQFRSKPNRRVQIIRPESESINAFERKQQLYRKIKIEQINSLNDYQLKIRFKQLTQSQIECMLKNLDVMRKADKTEKQLNICTQIIQQYQLTKQQIIDEKRKQQPQVIEAITNLLELIQFNQALQYQKSFTQQQNYSSLPQSCFDKQGSELSQNGSNIIQLLEKSVEQIKVFGRRGYLLSQKKQLKQIHKMFKSLLGQLKQVVADMKHQQSRIQQLERRSKLEQEYQSQQNCSSSWELKKNSQLKQRLQQKQKSKLKHRELMQQVRITFDSMKKQLNNLVSEHETNLMTYTAYKQRRKYIIMGSKLLQKWRRSNTPQNSHQSNRQIKKQVQRQPSDIQSIE